MSLRIARPSSVRRAFTLVVTLLVVVATADVDAREGGRRGGGGGRGMGGARMSRPLERPVERMAPAPIQRAQPMPEAAVPRAQPLVDGGPDAMRGGRPGRLTPEERRALRQQINDAGRDLYRPRHP